MTPDTTGPKPKLQSKKVFDVMKPGKAMATPSARPIIVGHKPQVHDSVSGVGSESPSLQHSKRKIELTHHDESQEAVAPKTAPVEMPGPPKLQPEKDAVAPATDTALPAISMAAEKEAPAAPAPEPSSEPQPKAEEPDPMAPVFDTPSPQAQAMPPAPDTKLAFDDTPAPIPGNQEIIVSHHGALDEPFKVIGLLLLIIILAVVAVDILLDAGILSVEALPHTDFLK